LPSTFCISQTCGSGPLLRMAGYSSPQVDYKLLVQTIAPYVRVKNVVIKYF
jgi:hypothetical protein